MSAIKNFLAAAVFTVLLIIFIGLALASISVGLFVLLVLLIMGAGLAELFDIIDDGI